MGGGGDNQIDPTADQNAQQKVNAELWNHYQTNYEPFIEKYSDQTIAGAPAQEQAVQSKLNADIMKQLPRPNANPVVGAQNTAKATNLATGAKMNAVGKASQRTMGNMENLVNIGRGQATQAQASGEALAQQSLQQEIGVNNINQQQSTNTVNTIGSAVGAGTALATRPQTKTLATV